VTYVYIIRSINVPDQFYIGWTTRLRERLASHNRGNSAHYLFGSSSFLSYQFLVRGDSWARIFRAAQVRLTTL